MPSFGSLKIIQQEVNQDVDRTSVPRRTAKQHQILCLLVGLGSLHRSAHLVVPFIIRASGLQPGFDFSVLLVARAAPVAALDQRKIQPGYWALTEIQAQDENNKMASRPAPSKGVVPNQKVSQVNSRRALGDIGNIVGDINVRCKEGALVKPLPQVTRPVTRSVISVFPSDLYINCTTVKVKLLRSFGAQLLANAQAAASKGISATNQQAQAEVIITKAEVKAEEKANWGNKQRRTSKTKDSSNATDVDAQSTFEDVVVVEPAARVKAPCHRNIRAAARKVKAPTLTATLTARSEAACGGFDAEMIEVEETLPNIDEGDLDNQLAVVEYVEDIYKFYRKIENMSCVPDYMSAQSEINDKMRAILIDWLIEVHLKFELMPETLYLTTNLLDRFLSIQPVGRKNLQLVGLTAMLLACKYEEIWAPEINDFVCISDRAYTRQQILAMEKTMLNKLKFNLTVPTPYVFLMEDMVFFLIELSLTQYVMIKYTPSMLAAAAVYTAQCTLKKAPFWNDILKRHTGISEEELKECARLMVAFHQNSGESKLKVVHKKYSGPQFSSVALISPAKLPAYREV
eukprot:Gb_03506 [translate_table: standard]